MNEIHGKLYVILGAARSGIAAAKLLIRLGARVRICDEKPISAITIDEKLNDNPNVEWLCGGDILDGLHGADALIISPGASIMHKMVVRAGENSIPVIGELEFAARVNNGTLIAITGTNGKTTTTALTGEIFRSAGKLAYVVGNIGAPFCDVADEIKREDVAVVEVSSFQMESASDFHPHVAALLNVTEDHLDRHGEMAVYIAMKMRVFARQTEQDFAVLNYDDPIVRGLAKEIKSKVVWFSRKEKPAFGAGVEDGNIVFYAGERRVICAVNEVRIPGPANLENALAATCIAMCMDVPPPVIRRALKTFKGVEHRLEFVREVDGIRFINDSKGTNVDSTIKAVESMTADTVIILGGYDKHTDFAPLARTIVDSGRICAAVLIGQTRAQIAHALRDAGFARVHETDGGFEAAVHLAKSIAKPGRQVLLSPACASFDMFKDFEQRGLTFKDIVNTY